jgi:hypothetical protein
MDIKDYETLITTQLDEIVSKIIKANPTLNIAVKKGERVGDAISKFLENKFVETAQNHPHFMESLASPSGKTKNPFDVQTVFEYHGHRELIWIDLKAVNVDNDDTNPDSGTPDKVITLIQSGFFYLAYVIVYYKGLNDGLEFVKYENNFVKSYFLKDINSSMHITPANQMQVNGFAKPEYRTREQFLDFLLKKKIESNERKLKKATEKLEIFKAGILKKKNKSEDEITIDKLKQLNLEQELKIKNL